MESKQLIAACGLGLALLGSPPAHAQHVPGIDRNTQTQARENRANLLREANRTLGELGVSLGPRRCTRRNPAIR